MSKRAGPVRTRSPKSAPAAAVPDPAARLDASGRRDALLALGGLGLALAGCGGGDDLAGVGTGGTGQIAYSSGPVSGFGSVIVNGVRFDDRGARVTDDAGRPRDLASLAIGMVVEVDGRVAEDGATGTAERIRIVSELRGPIESIDLQAGRFAVLGAVVQTGVATAFPDARGLAGLAVGALVEVHGFADVTAALLRATLVETPDAPVAARALKLRGTIGTLDAATGGFVVGGLAIDPRGARVSNAPATGLQAGQAVRLEGTASPRSGVWRPDTITVLEAGVGAGGSVRAQIEGTVVAFKSVSDLCVAGVPVDASGATFVDGLRPAQLRDGRRLRLIGLTSTDGRVMAKVVQPRDDDAIDGSGEDAVRFAGTILRFASLADFQVRDRAGRRFAVDGSGATLAPGTTVADLRLGAAVMVEGRRGTPFAATLLRAVR